MLNNKKYKIIKIGEITVISLTKNNYINATKLCYIYGKQFRHWSANKVSKEIISEVDDIINTQSIIKIMTGTIETRGTYVHPYILTHISCWMSPKFQVSVLHWIDQWKNNNSENTLSYNKEISNLKISNNEDIEKHIRDNLHNKIGGKIEVKTPVGRIDLLTKDKLIEIKEYSDWKCGLGQLIAYNDYKKNRKLCLYLFVDQFSKRIDNAIQDICNKNNIELVIKLEE